MEEMDTEVPWAKFRTELKEAPRTNLKGEDVWILKPGTFYLAESVEKLTLPKGLGVDVDTRSSWARYGARVDHVDDELGYLDGYKGQIPLRIAVSDVPVILRQNDRICQAVVYEGDKGMLENRAIYKAINSGEIECYRQAMFDMDVKLPSMQIDNHAIALTLHKIIKRFREGVIDPKQDMSKKHLDIDISGGHDMTYRKFFLGSSNEILRIGNGYVGLLREIFTAPERVRTHANAGYIDPGFEGTITLEQYLVEGGACTIYPDMKMGEVEVCTLKSQCTNPYRSKYSKQVGATPSMGHLDFK
jgi:dCTP deaminase